MSCGNHRAFVCWFALIRVLAILTLTSTEGKARTEGISGRQNEVKIWA